MPTDGIQARVGGCDAAEAPVPCVGFVDDDGRGVEHCQLHDGIGRGVQSPRSFVL